jgi:TonB family protein
VKQPTRFSNTDSALKLPGSKFVDRAEPSAPTMFATLTTSAETRARRRLSFLYGLLAEALLVEVAVVLGLSVARQLPAIRKHDTVMWIETWTRTPKRTPPPARAMARVVAPKVTPPEPVKHPPIPAPAVARLESPRPEPTILPVHAPAFPAPTPRVEQPAPTPRVQVTVHTGTFGSGAPEGVTTKRPMEQVQTGGFGSPQGLPGKALGDSDGNVPKMGLFGLPPGPGVGNGSGGGHGIPSVVASAGFGSGVAGSGSSHGGGGGGEQVSLGGFAKTVQTVRPTEVSLRNPPPAEFQSMEILSKPSPTYTDEARRSGIQGEVVLSVVFQANGAIRVLGVVSSLGYGLDRAAEEAAARIRFRPARRGGQPADFPATLRIQFRLADQPSQQEKNL